MTEGVDDIRDSIDGRGFQRRVSISVRAYNGYRFRRTGGNVGGLLGQLGTGEKARGCTMNVSTMPVTVTVTRVHG